MFLRKSSDVVVNHANHTQFAIMSLFPRAHICERRDHRPSISQVLPDHPKDPGVGCSFVTKGREGLPFSQYRNIHISLAALVSARAKCCSASLRVFQPESLGLEIKVVFSRAWSASGGVSQVTKHHKVVSASLHYSPETDLGLDYSQKLRDKDLSALSGGQPSHLKHLAPENGQYRWNSRKGGL